MSDLITLTSLATVPVILAVVQFAKQFGVAGKWATALAVALGLVFKLTDTLFGEAAPAIVDAKVIYAALAGGLLLGLGAAGLYDVAALVGGKSNTPQASDPVEADGYDPALPEVETGERFVEDAAETSETEPAVAPESD